MAAAIVPGLLIGAALGLLGGGGSVLTVPIFVYLLGFGAKEAIAMSLAVVGATSAVGTVMHWRAGNVNLRLGLAFGAVAAMGTIIGVRLATLVAGTTQLAVFGAVMLAAAAYMIRSRRDPAEDRALPAATSRTALMAVASGGLIVGVATGFVGVGGGFLIVPMLAFIRSRLREAIGTSLLIITVNSLVGLRGYIGHVEINWTAVVLVIGCTLPGIAAGSYFHRLVPQHLLRSSFAALLIVIAAFILFQTLALPMQAG